jgi:hypothetical protein
MINVCLVAVLHATITLLFHTFAIQSTSPPVIMLTETTECCCASSFLWSEFCCPASQKLFRNLTHLFLQLSVMCYERAARELHKIMSFIVGAVSCGFSSTSLPKANPVIVVMGGGNIQKDGEQGNGPPKPRCEASCRGLHGTRVKFSQCYGVLWVATSYIHLLVGPHMETKEKKTVFKTQKKREGLPSMDIPTINSLVGGRQIWHTIKGRWHNQQTCCCGFSQRKGRTSSEKPA